MSSYLTPRKKILVSENFSFFAYRDSKKTKKIHKTVAICGLIC